MSIQYQYVTHPLCARLLGKMSKYVEASKGMHVQRKKIKNLKDKSHIIIFLINMQCLQEPQTMTKIEENKLLLSLLDLCVTGFI